MEQRFFKIRLQNGRVIGPIDLERVKLFILKNQVSGLEMARLYPSGDWKDINKFPEIADLLMQKLEGRLAPTVTPDEPSVQIEEEKPSSTASGITIQEEPPTFTKQTGTPALQTSPSINDNSYPPPAKPAPEPTVVMTSDDEKTIVYTKDEEDKLAGEMPMESQSEPKMVALDSGQVSVELSGTGETDVRVDTFVASEKTAMLSVGGGASGPAAKQPVDTKKRKTFTLVVMAVLAIGVFFGSEEKKKPVDSAPFVVEMPTAKSKADPQKSETLLVSGLPYYVQDTVEGYKKAAKIFLDAVSYNPDNVRALCLLASSYMNLIDVVNRDENYFNVVTRIIELERAKNVDLGETVIADVELYHILGNPDAAITRIVEFSKAHQWGVDMLYYLSMSFYMKGKFPDALGQLNKIDPKDYFSPKIDVLYGMIYANSGQTDDAIRSFQAAVNRSPKHAKARSNLAELYFRKDNLPEAEKNAEFVIHNPSMASKIELARAHYIRAKVHQIAARDAEALQDIEAALKLTPDDHDMLLDYYTLKSKMGSKVNDPSGKAKMFHFLAEGEKALKANSIDSALSNFLSARDAQYDDVAPLLKIAEVFQRKGDLQSAKTNLSKAIQLDKKRAELYPKYIKVLIDAYEFEDAAQALALYKEMSPPTATIDRLQGDFYLKQERFNEALAYYKRALSSNNVDSSVYVAYATLMFKTGSFRDAAFYYGLARRFDPFNVEATVGIGMSLAELEGVEIGVQYVQNALETSPHKAALLNGVGEIYERKGDHMAAMKFADNALATDATFALAHKTRGDAFSSLNKIKEALDCYRTYTNLAPLDPSGPIARYRIFIKKLDLKAAKEEIQKVIDNFPKYPGAYYMLGDLFREGQNYRASLDAALIEIKHNPGYVPAYVLAGTAYNRNKDYTNALGILAKGLKLAPNHVPTLVQAGFANHMLKTYAAAQSMFERALQLDQGNPQIHKRLGSLHHDLGNRDRAKQHFRAYLDLFPDAPDRKDMEAYVNQ